MSLKDIWCLSPPNIINSPLSIAEQWPSRAQGFFPMTKFELFCRGAKNLDYDYLPKSVNLSDWLLLDFPSGFPITSREFFIAWEEV